MSSALVLLVQILYRSCGHKHAWFQALLIYPISNLPCMNNKITITLLCLFMQRYSHMYSHIAVKPVGGGGAGPVILNKLKLP